MQKTKQPLELPLLEDVGWALIDYLKNGRPQTKSDCVFVRHKAPYDGFADRRKMPLSAIPISGGGFGPESVAGLDRNTHPYEINSADNKG